MVLIRVRLFLCCDVAVIGSPGHELLTARSCLAIELFMTVALMPHAGAMYLVSSEEVQRTSNISVFDVLRTSSEDTRYMASAWAL